MAESLRCVVRHQCSETRDFTRSSLASRGAHLRSSPGSCLCSSETILVAAPRRVPAAATGKARCIRMHTGCSSAGEVYSAAGRELLRNNIGQTGSYANGRAADFARLPHDALLQYLTASELGVLACVSTGLRQIVASASSQLWHVAVVNSLGPRHPAVLAAALETIPKYKPWENGSLKSALQQRANVCNGLCRGRWTHRRTPRSKLASQTA